MSGLSELVAALALLGPWWPAPVDARAVGAPPAREVHAAAFVRTRGDRFELVSGAGARPLFFRGVNLGAGAPGHFPGEFAFTKEDYRRYLRFARDLHANAIRLYTLHPPSFYEALREENLAHPDRPLWLFQGVWTELPESNDLWEDPFRRGFEEEIRRVVDAVHGNAELAPRRGHAAGRYDSDVSPWLAGWMLGREWEPYAVRETERRHPERTRFRGAYFTVDRGTAVETWLARMCEVAVSHERWRYGLARAVSFVTWPTLDVMRHPTESEDGAVEAEHDEDAYAVDPTRIRPRREPGLASGFLGYFANYHVYPYYPDFLNLDPGYASARDRHGACNYAGYLRDLKAHTPGLPLLIGEYGVPSSRGVAHLQPQGIDHGGASELAQGMRNVRLLEDIVDAGAAGAVLFALFDEWFKVNWLVWPTERPRERDPLWHNLLDAEEGYGLIAFDPPPRIRVDGRVEDWQGIAPYAEARDGRRAAGRSRPPGRGGSGGGPAARSSRADLRALYVTSDASRFYLRLDVSPRALRGRIRALGVALDVLDPARGDTRLPAPLDATWSRGAEFVLVIVPGRGGRDAAPRAQLFIDRHMNWSSYARVLERDSLVPHRAAFRPVANDDGRYAPLVIETNRRRVGRSGEVYPAQHVDWGRLTHGRESPARGAAGDDTTYAYDPRAEWWIDRSRGVIEVALPWGLLNVGDPSSRAILDDVPETPEIECSVTDGVGLLAWAIHAPGFRADSLGPAAEGVSAATPGACEFLGPGETVQSVVGQQVHIVSPTLENYLWSGWDVPITRERIKRSADPVRRAFEVLESREPRPYRDLDAAVHSPSARRRPRRPARADRARRAGAGRRLAPARRMGGRPLDGIPGDR